MGLCRRGHGMLNSEQLETLRTEGRVLVSIVSTPQTRETCLKQLQEKYTVEEKQLYHTSLFLVKERK
jgi:hypothetical protein